MKIRKQGFAMLLISSCLALINSSLYGQEKLQFTLEQAQRYGIEHSYLSQSASMEVQKSKRKVKETIAMGLPQVNATGNYQKYLELPVQLVPAESFGGARGEYVEFTFGTEQQMGVDIRATQLLFDGSYFVGLQASRVYLELTKNDKEKTETEVKQMIAQAYGNVLVTEENAEILSLNIVNLKKNLDETKALYESGFAEEQDRDQLELLLANAKSAYDQASRLIEISRNQLKFAMGIDIENEIELLDGIDEVTLESTDEDYLNNDFDIKSHIDYKLVATQKEASKLLWKQQRSTYLPSLNAFYSYQQNSYSSKFDFLDEARWFPTQTIGLNLSVPIFSGFERNNKVQQAKIDFEIAELVEKQLTQKLQIDIANARSEYTFALSQFQTSKQNIKLAERIYHKMQTKYEEGVSTSLELTQANEQLLNTQSSYINAAIQLINAKSNLDKALNK